jgi:hypothetical protein
VEGNVVVVISVSLIVKTEEAVFSALVVEEKGRVVVKVVEIDVTGAMVVVKVVGVKVATVVVV